MAVVAAVATLAWSIVDHPSKGVGTLRGWTRVWLRYVLAISMLTYGFVKVVKPQFPSPSPARLGETTSIP